jgi:hypothetical protein
MRVVAALSNSDPLHLICECHSDTQVSGNLCPLTFRFGGVIKLDSGALALERLARASLLMKTLRRTTPMGEKENGPFGLGWGFTRRVGWPGLINCLIEASEQLRRRRDRFGCIVKGNQEAKMEILAGEGKKR